MKIKTHFSCQGCGYSTSKWLGRCPGCNEWNTLVEERIESDSPSQNRTAAGAAKNASATRYEPLEQEDSAHPNFMQRTATGIAELDRVLGGGLVPDSFILLGGDPGIGKSTLLLQMARDITRTHAGLKLLYVSGEESLEQIRGRAKRLGVQSRETIYLAAETILEKVLAAAYELRPQVLVLDSIQTFGCEALQSAPGSVSQVREVALRLMSLAKTERIAVWLVGHVTKDGTIAGPKTIEHMVDTVLYFEGDGGQSYRLLRTVKNRFGSTQELGVFEMEGEGLREVSNPSLLFLSDRKTPVSGTAVAASLEGSRPILIELQALVSTSGLAMPRRTAVGVETARISLLSAILERHMGISLSQKDLYFNVAGGLRLNEPACDLAAAAAIWSSFVERAIPEGWVFIGELGLTGEVRRVSRLDARISEAAKLGFTTVVIPDGALSDKARKNLPKIAIKTITRIGELPKLF